MHRLLTFCCGILFLSLLLSAPVAHAQIWAPDHKPLELGIGFQYTHYNIGGTQFHNLGEDASFTYHIIDPLTGAGARLTGSIEGAVMAGFDGHPAGASSQVNAKSLFVGGGPHVALESPSRYTPWVHLLFGLDRVQLTAANRNAFGFVGGGGVDVNLVGPISWRVQADYLGTHFKTPAWVQSNYAFGTGVVLTFR
ncbi:MAG: hypothetical protein LAO19_13635 [Acidobacteriia bacterium]|nr:hypothetical protein [Terriglobia bacterium]